MSKQAIAAFLRAARDTKRLTQSQVGVMVGKSQKAVASWESGKSQPDIDMLFRLCEIYDLDIVELYAAIDDKKKAPDLVGLSDAEKQLIRDLRAMPDDCAAAVMKLAHNVRGKDGTTSAREIDMQAAREIVDQLGPLQG